MTAKWFHIEAEQQGLDMTRTDSFLINSLFEMPKRSSRRRRDPAHLTKAKNQPKQSRRTCNVSLNKEEEEKRLEAPGCTGSCYVAVDYLMHLKEHNYVAFDDDKFKFTTVGQEVLFWVAPSNDNKCQFFSSAAVGSDLNSPNIVTINVSPIEYEHVLLIPRFGTVYHREVIVRLFLLAPPMAKEAADP
jgi:hypothetical protein